MGLFGKLPARGDFVRVELPGGFVQPWDAWLSAGIAAARASLAEDWQAAWFEAPVWCFALGAGACGPQPAGGVLLPSLDKVGRLFPLTIACVGGVPEDPEWFAGAEALGRNAVEHDADPAEVAAGLARLPPVPDGSTLSGARFWTEGAPRVPPAAYAWPSLLPPQDFMMLISATPEAAA